MGPNPIWLLSLEEKIRTQTCTKGRYEDTEYMAICKPRRGHRGTHAADTFILDFQPPELWENKCLLFNPPICSILLQQPELTDTGGSKISAPPQWLQCTLCVFIVLLQITYCLVYKLHVNWRMQYAFSCDLLFFAQHAPHIYACWCVIYVLSAEWYFIMWIYHHLSLWLVIDTWWFILVH